MKRQNDTLIKSIAKQLQELQVTQTDLLSQLHNVIQQDCSEEEQLKINDRVKVKVNVERLQGHIVKITKKRLHV